MAVATAPRRPRVVPPEDIVRPRTRRRRPSVGAVTGVIVGLLVFLIAVRPAVDNDLWFHLRTARWMLDHHHFVGIDPFTHTRPGVVRVQTDWLAQLVYYGAWRVAGLAGIAVLVASVATGAMVVLYRTIRGSVAVRAGVVLLTAAASSIFWSARPQIFTFLGTVIVSAILRRWRITPERLWVWALVPIVVLWANTHGGVVYGFLIIGGTVVGEWANAAITRYRPLRSLRVTALAPDALRRLTTVSLVCAIGLAVNPSGWRIYGLPFHQVASSTQYVQEFRAPSVTDPTAAPFFLLLALTMGLVAWRWRHLDAVDVILVVGGALLALQFTRSIPFFAVVAAPVLARHSAAIVEERRRTDAAPARLIALAGALAVVVLALTVVRVGGDRVDERLEAEFPVAATEWLNEQRPPGELFNTFDWGGYLMWQAPEYRVSVDGRTDVYDEHLDTYYETITAQPGWQAELDRERIGTVLVDSGSGLADALGQDPGWRPAYEDPVAVVFVRR